MGYIRKVITSDEKLLAIFRPHWIYAFEGLLSFAVLTAAGFILDYYLYEYFGQHAIKFKIDLWVVQFDEHHTPIPWAAAFCGFAIFWSLFLAYISAEVGLTNQRIIYKRGLIFIEIDQIDLEDIRAEHVMHGWFGWLLGYGRIRLDCRFVDDVWLPAIRNPYRLVKASHTARMRHPGIDYSQDDLNSNLRLIEQQRQQAKFKEKIGKLKQDMKKGFVRAA